MKKREISFSLKMCLMAFSVPLIAICIYTIIETESAVFKVLCGIAIAAILAADVYLLFCTKGIYMDESNKQYRDKVYLQSKPSFLSSDEKFLDISAIDDIVAKATSIIDKNDVPEHELCPICGKEVKRGNSVIFYVTSTTDKSETKYWGDEFGNYVRPVYEENQHINRNDEAVIIKCAACGFQMTVGWIKKTITDAYGDKAQMLTRAARVGGVKLCQASSSKLAKELKIAGGIERIP